MIYIVTGFTYNIYIQYNVKTDVIQAVIPQVTCVYIDYLFLMLKLTNVKIAYIITNAVVCNWYRNVNKYFSKVII